MSKTNSRAFINSNEYHEQKKRNQIFRGGEIMMNTNKYIDEISDFSSPVAWDDYYRTHSDINESRLEWHSSINMERLVQEIILDTSNNSSVIESTNNDEKIPRKPRRTHRILMIGCGNSLLPNVLLDNIMKKNKNSAIINNNTNISITLLDTSSSVLDQVREDLSQMNFQNCDDKNHFSNISIEYVCGDATNLPLYFSSKEHKFDTIIDKGLLDALLCGEGWEPAVESLFEGASKILKTSSTTNACNSGRYILVSYQLSTSMRQYLKRITEGNKSSSLVSSSSPWSWDFNISSLSNNRVSVSVAYASAKT